MLAIPFCLERSRLLRLDGESFIQARPPTPEGADIDGTACSGIHVSDRSLDLSDDGLLFQREENGRAMVSCWLNEVLAIRNNELSILVSGRSYDTGTGSRASSHTESGYLTCLRMSRSYLRIAGTTDLAWIMSSYSCWLRNSS